MRRLLLLSALAVAIAGAGSGGCSTKPVVREKPLADPLLVSKKPVEGKQHLVAPREAQGGPPRQEIRHVGTKRHRKVMEPTGGHRGTPQPPENPERCRTVAAAAAETSL